MSRLVAAILLLAAPVLAAEAEHAAEHGVEPSIGDLFLPTINFAIFAFIVARYVWPVVVEALVDRRRKIEHDLRESDKVEREAHADLAEIQALRAALEAEGRKLLEELRTEGERDRQAILEAARRAAERIRADAARLGDTEAARAAEDVRRDVAARVISRAVDKLRGRLGDEERRRFVDEFIDGLQERAA
jgi:F-type H+-transporting ATPase subunit b